MSKDSAKMQVVKVPVKLLRDDDIIVVNGEAYKIVIEKSRPGKNIPMDRVKHHIAGCILGGVQGLDVMHNGGDLVDKLIPTKCNMKIVSIEGDTCTLSNDGTQITGVALPRARNNIVSRVNANESFNLKVDNYLDLHFVIRNNPSN